MITRPVAVTRGVLAAAAIGVVGAGIIVLGFSLAGADRTITDVQGAGSRVNVLWWGSTAFVACAAILAGVIAGGMALTGAGLSSPGRAVLTVATPLALLTVASIGTASGLGWLADRTALPVGVGCAIGFVGGALYVIQRGVIDQVPQFSSHRELPASRAWGSR